MNVQFENAPSPLTLFSSWTPPRGNPYLCFNCYNDTFREKRRPSRKDLTCLCTRRSNLQILTLNKRFYGEASQVFYATNTFAFGHRVVLTRFLASISPQTRDRITKISYLASYPTQPLEDVESGQHCWQNHQALPWNLIAGCKSLRVLELDVFFILNFKLVKKIRQIYRLSHMSFSLRPPKEPDSSHLDQWEQELPFKGIVARRVVLKGGYAEAMARLMKRDRQCSVKELENVWKKHWRERRSLSRIMKTWEEDD